jgi:hypothetical protein
MFRTISGLEGPYRVLGALALAIQLALVIMLGGEAVAKGAALVGFERRYYVPGDIAHGRLGISSEVADEPPVGRLSVYLIPWSQWANQKRISMRTFPVSGDRVTIRGDLAVVRFVVRQVPWGRYRVAVCHRGGPCGRGRVERFRNGSVYVVSDRQSVSTWRTLADVSREVETLQMTSAQHADVLKIRAERIEALEEQVGELETKLDRIGAWTSDPRPEGPDGWVAATWTVLLAVAVLGLVGRRRNSQGLHSPALPHRR